MAVTYGSGSFKTVSERIEAEGDNSGLAEDELISRNIQKISHNVLQIKNMVQNIGTPLDSEELRHRMSILQGETNQLTKDTNTFLKEILVPNKAADDKEQERLKIKIRLLRENFHDVLKDYNGIQKTAKTKQRQTIRKKLRDSVTQGDSTATQEEDLNQTGLMSEAGEMLQIEIVQGEVDLELVKEREKALQQLEEDIIDINIIFKDLAMMVHEQGEDITIIEENVDNAVTDVEEGVKQLVKAEDYQSSARRKKLFLVIILAAVLVVIAVIITVVVTQTT